MPVRYILSSLWVRLRIFSPLSITHHMGLYVFSFPISLVMIERIHIRCLIIIIKSEVWTITHCLGLGHETIVSAVYLSYRLFASEMPQWFLLNWKFPFRLWRMFDAEIKRGDGYVKYCPISWFAPKSSQRSCWVFIRIDQRHAWHRADLKFRIQKIYNTCNPWVISRLFDEFQVWSPLSQFVDNWNPERPITFDQPWTSNPSA